MVISKNSKDKRSLYLKYVNDIIKSLEEDSETWRMIVRGNSDKKKFYADDFFNLVINLEGKVVNIFRRATRGNEEPKLLIDTIGPFKIRKKEVEFVFNGLMVSDISLLSELICHYDEDDVFAGLFSMEWESEEKLKSELITKLKMFLFDAIFSDHFYEENVKHWFGVQQDILFSDSIPVKSIFTLEDYFESDKKNFDKNIIEILGGEIRFDG
jgi:hypothetical protein